MINDQPSRALSIRQPWAWLIVHGPKYIENRNRYSSFRGRFLVHASKYQDLAYYLEATHLAKRWAPNVEVPPMSKLEYGGIVGEASVVDVLPPHPPTNAPWRSPDHYGYVLESRRPLPFQPMAGRVTLFWRVDTEPPRRQQKAAPYQRCPLCKENYLRCGCDR